MCTATDLLLDVRNNQQQTQTKQTNKQNGQQQALITYVAKFTSDNGNPLPVLNTGDIRSAKSFALSKNTLFFVRS
ncbi:hypothetical protein RFI_38318 [Reticulomyxa filosa]|uniref:Uncharacterized protein n=1 Tax=Reticulomyxa filosa TaxID=46433 RepID=X6LC93_RETFI|nr:hypothetical protein RFI_38318 [Reticulomyxa filosa]|eukprot:ETN99163.1 hypothetical protein RFI_38318 [Reticulomyxa filosa]